MHILYKRHVIDYEDHIRGWAEYQTGCRDITYEGSELEKEVRELPDYPSFEAWIGRKDGVPGSQAFSQVMEDAYYADGGAGDTSRNMYRTRSAIDPVPLLVSL